MDLRDEFACRAMNGFISGFCTHENVMPIQDMNHALMADISYKVADIMLAARNKTDTKGNGLPSSCNNFLTCPGVTCQKMVCGKCPE